MEGEKGLANGRGKGFSEWKGERVWQMEGEKGLAGRGAVNRRRQCDNVVREERER